MQIQDSALHIFRRRLALGFVAAVSLAATLAYGDIEPARLDAIAADLQARVDEGRLSGVVAMAARF